MWFQTAHILKFLEILSLGKNGIFEFIQICFPKCVLGIAYFLLNFYKRSIYHISCIEQETDPSRLAEPSRTHQLQTLCPGRVSSYKIDNYWEVWALF